VHDTVSEPGALIVYRGPWQGRRVRFLLDAFHQCFGDVDFVWVNPRFDPAGDRAWAHSLCSERPYVSSAQEIDGKLSAFVPTCARLARDFRRGRLVCGIGFTAVLYARALRPARIVWAVNGIPEERLLYDRGLVSRTAVEAAWLLARLGRKPDAAVVVSGPMGRHVSDRMGGALPWAKAPTSVDIAVFDQPSAPVRSWFTYVGSGAPWQGIDLLARVWKEVARIDPTARFRVVSRDDRAKLLLAGIPDDRGEMVEARGPAQVAGFLSEALLGFLIRKRDIVNETSFPTKFGEYLAAGVPVVTTDIGWEIADIVRDADCGLLVDPEASPELVADQIVRYADAVRCDRDASERCTRASVSLSRDAWLDSLVADLGEIL
jgi:glycosyltransferase involved in cell wall biosynthesis